MTTPYKSFYLDNGLHVELFYVGDNRSTVIEGVKVYEDLGTVSLSRINADAYQGPGGREKLKRFINEEGARLLKELNVSNKYFSNQLMLLMEAADRIDALPPLPPPNSAEPTI